MAKNWYPVIDPSLCTSCGACVEFCTHGVYDKTKSPDPHLIQPDACIDHCHGCGNVCPVGAITYYGEDTDWTPAHKVESSGCCGDTPCACGDGDVCQCGDSGECTCADSQGAKPASVEDTVQSQSRNIVVDFLYLDLNTCERCQSTDAVLDEAVDELSDVLRQMGYTITVNKTNVQSEKMARAYRLISSPTIHVNGRDIFADVVQNECTDCGDICGCDTTCRTFTYGDKQYDSPPKAMIMDGILRAIYGPESNDNKPPYVLPDNLKRFFDGVTAQHEQ